MSSNIVTAAPADLKEKRRELRESYGDKEVFSMNEFAGIAEISYSTLYRYVNAGRVNCMRRTPHAPIRFSINEVSRFLLEGPLPTRRLGRRSA